MKSARGLAAGLALTGLGLGLHGCNSTQSHHYVVRVTPSALAEQQAVAVDFTLTRMDTSETAQLSTPLPSPTPAAPWTYDLGSHVWGNAPLRVDASARGAMGVLARGTGTPVGDTIDVLLSDINTPSDMGGPDLVGSCLTTLSLAAEADTVISPTSGNLGAQPVLDISAASNSIALMRFNLSTLPATATIAAAKLTLTYIPFSGACGGACASCAASEQSGGLQAYFLTSDWVESEATWLLRKTGVTWAMSGASGGGDRSAAPVALLTRLAQQSAELTFTAASDFGGFRIGNGVSFLVTAPSGHMHAAAREAAGETCPSGPFAAPKLDITYCP